MDNGKARMRMSGFQSRSKNSGTVAAGRKVHATEQVEQLGRHRRGAAAIPTSTSVRVWKEITLSLNWGMVAQGQV
jgi:hypothetical protein